MIQWDPHISIETLGIVLTFLLGGLGALWKVISNFTTLTTATNNLAAITAQLQENGKSLEKVLMEVKDNQTLVKSDLLESQARIKADLLANQSETTQALAVHVAKDEERFSAVTSTLLRLDTYLQSRRGI